MTWLILLTQLYCGGPGFWSYLNDNNFGEKQTQLFNLLSYSYEVTIEAHIL